MRVVQRALDSSTRQEELGQAVLVGAHDTAIGQRDPAVVGEWDPVTVGERDPATVVDTQEGVSAGRHPHVHVSRSICRRRVEGQGLALTRPDGRVVEETGVGVDEEGQTSGRDSVHQTVGHHLDRAR